MSNPTPPPLVVHIIYALGTGGLENGLVNIINRMPAERFRHAIVCLTQAHEFKNRITASGVELYELNMKSGHDFKLYRRLGKLLKSLNPAIVHTRNLAALEMQLVTLFATKAKRVHGEHGRDIYDLDGLNAKYNWLRRFMALIMNRYITVSQDLKLWLQDTVKVNPKKISHIYNGVDQKHFSPNEKGSKSVLPDQFVVDKSIVIGTVGRLAPVKDQLSLVDAFSQVLTKRPEYREYLRLVIVGDGPSRQKLEARGMQAGLAEVSWFPGDRTDIPKLLAAMDIFVLPSLGEGVSNTILEAMATGLPIIATDVGGNPELVEPDINGFLVPVGNASQLAASIETLVQAPEVRRRFGAASRLKITEKFNWDKTVSAYMQVYDELLRN